MDRLTERTGEGQAIPRMDLKSNGHQKCMERLAEYEDLEEQGKLLKLPCAVGDTVYTACSWGIESGIVGSIEIISDRIFVNNTRGQMIGEARNIFLTREEAEVALKELDRR